MVFSVGIGIYDRPRVYARSSPRVYVRSGPALPVAVMPPTVMAAPQAVMVAPPTVMVQQQPTMMVQQQPLMHPNVHANMHQQAVHANMHQQSHLHMQHHQQQATQPQPVHQQHQQQQAIHPSFHQQQRPREDTGPLCNSVQDVHKKVQVWWGQQQRWCSGLVQNYNPQTKVYHVHYADGNKQDYKLFDCPTQSMGVIQVLVALGTSNGFCSAGGDAGDKKPVICGNTSPDAHQGRLMKNAVAAAQQPPAGGNSSSDSRPTFNNSSRQETQIDFDAVCQDPAQLRAQQEMMRRYEEDKKQQENREQRTTAPQRNSMPQQHHAASSAALEKRHSYTGEAISPQESSCVASGPPVVFNHRGESCFGGPQTPSTTHQSPTTSGGQNSGGLSETQQYFLGALRSSPDDMEVYQLAARFGDRESASAFWIFLTEDCGFSSTQAKDKVLNSFDASDFSRLPNHGAAWNANRANLKCWFDYFWKNCGFETRQECGDAVVEVMKNGIRMELDAMSDTAAAGNTNKKPVKCRYTGNGHFKFLDGPQSTQKLNEIGNFLYRNDGWTFGTRQRRAVMASRFRDVAQAEDLFDLLTGRGPNWGKQGKGLDLSTQDAIEYMCREDICFAGLQSNVLADWHAYFKAQGKSVSEAAMAAMMEVAKQLLW